ncbi:DUF1643 domain-containing protein [Radicibacter daui]|uniref:DUF1643 domain-containing protein n=1 Tax=Radicibacter daui TaxID=3064829 RepID=UPI004046E820
MAKQGVLFEFEPESAAVAAHKVGGKVKTALPAGLRGDAVFSECGRYRPLLRRWVGDAFPERYAMWIGMNASTATAEANDPTITREWGFTTREGYSGYLKCNIGDYRATDPKALLQPGIEARSSANLPAILTAARKACIVIVCHGKLNQALKPHGDETVAALRAEGIELWCLGVNGDGSPKHPLYLRADAPLIRLP